MTKLFKTRKDFYYKIIAFSIVTIFSFILNEDNYIRINPFRKLELDMLDRKFNARERASVSDSTDVIIISIDQNSYDQIPSPYNTWPWPRNFYAKVIENLNQAGVKAIGIDILLANKDRFSNSNDSLLVSVIKKYRNVILAGKIDVNRESLQEISDNSSGFTAVIRKMDENFGSVFYQADSSIGIVQVAADYDEIFRRYKPFVYSAIYNIKIPTFSFAILNKLYKKNTQFTAINKENYFLYEDIKIPKYDRNSFLINFYGIEPGKNFKYISFIDVLDDKEFETIDEIELNESINTWDNPDYGLKQSGLFKDKIVIIGSTMPEDKDMLPVAVSKGNLKGDNIMYGAEFHATVLQNLLWKHFLYIIPSYLNFLFTALFSFLAFFGSIFLRQSSIKSGFLVEISNFLFFIFSIIGVYYFSIFLFVHFSLVLFVFPLFTAVTFGYVASTAYNFITAKYQNVVIKKLFEHYVNKHLVNELINNPEKLALGGQTKELSILFMDLKNFTSFSENLSPKQLVSIMNTYLNEMTEIIMSNNGTLDKYIGDAIMAFWGAPIDNKDHAYYSCLTAVKMQNRLSELSELWKKDGLRNIEAKIGINSGNVIVGNIGSKKRFDYTVMGDDVNLGSRLEGVNNIYGTGILISEKTYEKCKSKIKCREIDTIRVKGRNRSVKIYELLAVDTFTVKSKNEGFQNFENGLNLYKSRLFAEAIKYFQKEYDEIKDETSRIYIERCQKYLDNPPPENWDGVFSIESK